jgi:aspartate carbamoyltransferase
MPSLISIDDISNDKVISLFRVAKKYRAILKNSRAAPRDKALNSSLKSFNIGILFFEESTRTKMSFETAINRCSGNYINFNQQQSSSKKGEVLSDTLKTIERYCDLFVIRHPTPNIMRSIQEYINIPIINAGDGTGEHPTQALLDLFTIQSHFNDDVKSILFVGDLKGSRPVHSLVKLLVRFYKKNIKIFLLELPDFELDITGFSPEIFTKVSSYDECISEVDVVYMTRLQVERYKDKIDNNIFNESLIETKYYKPLYMNPSIMYKMKPVSILMHPLPRNNEISPLCDADPRSKYFQQVENGVYVRMALLNYCLNDTVL